MKPDIFNIEQGICFDTQSHKQQIHGIIVGGSITGLSAAIALRRAGYRVTVLEKDARITEEISGGCRIAPNLHKILREWGLETELEKITSRPKTINMLSYNSGSYLGSIRWEQEILKETNGEFGLTTYSALRILLYRNTISRGASVRFGTEVVSLDTRISSASVTLKSGEVVRADLLIGADGVNGVTRKYMNSSVCPPDVHQGDFFRINQLYEGVETGAKIEGIKLKMFSTTIPKKSILNDPQLAYLINRRENDMFVWLGHEHSAVGFPSVSDLTPDSELYHTFPSILSLCFSQLLGFNGRSMSDYYQGKSRDFSLCVYGLESENRTQDLGYILRGAEPSLLKLSRIASETSSSLTYAPLNHENVLDTWTDGSLVVIGEAAHPLPPGSVQSCALSVEDGAVLAKLFSPRSFHGSSHTPSLVSDIPTLLAAFQSIRYRRCASVQTREIGIIHYMTMPGASEAERNVREQGMRARRDAMEIAVVPVPLEILHYLRSDFAEAVEEGREEGDDLYVNHTSPAENADNGLEISPEWVEVTEVFGYQAEEEAEEWWATWGRYQILNIDDDSGTAYLDPSQSRPLNIR